MHEVLVNRLGGLSLPGKSVVRLTDRPDLALDVYRGRKTAIQQLKCTVNNNGHVRTSVSLTALFLGRLRPPKHFTSAKYPYFHQLLGTALLGSVEVVNWQ